MQSESSTTCNYRSQLDYITIGLPFGIFKILFALALSRASTDLVSTGIAFSLIALGTLDLLFNTLNIIACLALRKQIIPVCTFAILFTYLSRKAGHDAPKHARRVDLGMALDVMLSFILVALCLGLKYLAYFTPNELLLWNISVIFNVLGAGISRMLASMEKSDAH